MNTYQEFQPNDGSGIIKISDTLLFHSDDNPTDDPAVSNFAIFGIVLQAHKDAIFSQPFCSYLMIIFSGT